MSIIREEIPELKKKVAEKEEEEETRSEEARELNFDEIFDSD
jgi:hypothetical protein